MNPNATLTVYGMIGPMGSGKTTLALKIAKETGALFQSLDGTIKDLNEPIGDLAGYERLMLKALEKMYANALAALKSGRHVVFDVARWPWLMELANEGDAKIEIYHFNISAEERWLRVQKRNHEKTENVYHNYYTHQFAGFFEPTVFEPLDTKMGLTIVFDTKKTLRLKEQGRRIEYFCRYYSFNTK